jgi:hypothetical protein
MDRINLQEPYMLIAPIDTGMQVIFPERVTYDLRIWTGDVVTDKPAQPTYTLEKLPRFNQDKHIYLNISPLVLDFIQHNYVDLATNEAVFVDWVITSYYKSGS